MQTQIKNAWPLVGNEHIAAYLRQAISKDTVSGTYIFSGVDDLGKTTTAVFFAKLLLCAKPQKLGEDLLPCETCRSCRRFGQTGLQGESDPEQSDFSQVSNDLYLLRKEKDKKDIPVDHVRDFIHALSMSSFGGAYKIGIIKQAENLNQSGANALLKTLEEPKERVLIILIVKDIDSLPETIISRSQYLRFRPASIDQVYDFLVQSHGVSREKARDAARLSLGRPALALKHIKDEEFHAQYLSRADSFLELPKLSAIERFQLIENLIDKKVQGQEAVGLSRRVLEIWQGLTRDMLLLNLGHNNLVQHVYASERLKEAMIRLGPEKLLALSLSFRSAYDYIESNVNPRTVLENVIIDI